MRVDLYSPAAISETTSKPTKTSTNSVQSTLAAEKSRTEDTTSLTSASESVQSLTEAALETIPSRADKVAALKQAVAAGQYQLDPAKIADSLSTSDL